jgi:hypothetical protein
MVEIKCCHLWREKMNLGTCIMIWWILHAYNVSIEQFLSWNKLKRCWKSPGNGVLMPWKGKNWRYQNWSYSCPPANSHVQNSAFVDHVPKESHGFFHIGFFWPGLSRFFDAWCESAKSGSPTTGQQPRNVAANGWPSRRWKQKKRDGDIMYICINFIDIL